MDRLEFLSIGIAVIAIGVFANKVARYRKGRVNALELIPTVIMVVAALGIAIVFGTELIDSNRNLAYIPAFLFIAGALADAIITLMLSLRRRESK